MKTTATHNSQTTESKSVANRTIQKKSARVQATLSGVQAKLTIGQPNDTYEQEADRVANTVVNMSDPLISSTGGGSEYPAVQNKSIGDSITPWVQNQQLEEEPFVQQQAESISQAFIPTTSSASENASSDLPFTPDMTSKASLNTHFVDIQRQEEEDELVQTGVQRMKEEELQTQSEIQRKSSNQNSHQLTSSHIQFKTQALFPNRNKGTPLIQRHPEGNRIRDSSSSSPPISIQTSRAPPTHRRNGSSLLQRSSSPDSQRGPPVNTRSTSSIEQTLSSTGGGMPMPEKTKSFMENRFGRDFSKVRIHTDQRAIQMSKTLHAKAFAHGNNIYFNHGKFNPDSSAGKHLLAHELTHTVQQGASTQAINRKVSPQGPSTISASSTNGKHIQCGWLDSAWDSVSGAVNGAVDWAADQLSAGIDWIKRQARNFVSNIHGYRLFTVVIGHDPVSGERVDRSGRNFIEAGIDIIPGGTALKQKLEEEGALSEAAQWLDGEIATLDLNPTAIASQIAGFFSGLSVTDLASPGDVLQRLSAIISAPVHRVITFAVNIGTKLLEIVKRYLIHALITFIRERTNAYPLLTVILERDPISGEAVERTPLALLRGFMQLTESGQEQLRQMEESGSLQRAAEWLDGAIARLNITPEIIQETFANAWGLVSIESLLHPVDAFAQLYHIFAGPVGRIISFLIEVAIQILRFIKDALIRRLVAYARNTRGYLLLTVILAKDPFSGEHVERNTENLVHGFMALKDGGEEQFQEMKQSGAIDRMTARIEAAVASLNFTWEYIRQLFVRAWESLSLSDLANPLAAFARIVGIFADPLMRIIHFVVEIIRIVIEVLLSMMNFPFQLIASIINHVRQAIQDIARDPIGFLKNLIRAVRTGFAQFFDNILTHLLDGLVSWLFSELDEAGISPPDDLSFGSILGMVLQVLGLRIERIWSKIAERIGQEKVDRIRGMVDRLSGIWSFIKDIQERGLVAIWEYIQGQLSNLWNIVMESIRNWIVTRIIQQITARLLSMLDPTGIMAVINGFMAFFNAVQSFIKYLREMLGIVNSFVSGIAEIATGNIAKAANFLEGSLARAIPVAIGFLANQVGLSGLGHRIGEMIERVRTLVDQALDWLIDRAINAGTAFINLGSNAINAAREWWRSRKTLTTQDGHHHTVYFNGESSSASLMINSEPISVSGFLNNLVTQHNLEESQVAQARLKATAIDAKKQEQVPENEEQAHGAEIDVLVEELATELQSIPLNTTAGTVTPPIYGPTRGGFGTIATRAYMDKGPGFVDGTDAFQNVTPSYTKLNRRRYGNGAYYIRGHLLNGRLGGDGHSWNNLTPLFITANNPDMYQNFEQELQAAVLGDGYVKDFRVVAHYNNTINSSAINLLRNMDSEDYPAYIPQNLDADQVADSMEAEQYVPSSLSCEAKVKTSPSATEEQKSYTLNNPIGPPYTYEATDKVDFIISQKINLDNEEASVAALQELRQVGEVRARNAFQIWKTSGRKTYRNLFGVTRKYLQTQNRGLNIKIN